MKTKQIMQKKTELAEVTEVVNKVRTIGSKEVGQTPEEKAQQEQELKEQKIAEAKQKAKEIAEKMVKKQFRTMFLQVYEEILKGKTLEDITEEINQKKSRMTRSARDFVINFEPERIKQWIDDETKEREAAFNRYLEKHGATIEETK